MKITKTITKTYEIDDYDLDELSDHIYDLYNDGEMSSSQYDDLMSYIDDLS